MRLRSLAAALVTTFALSGLAHADTPSAPKWEMFDEEDGIRMYRRDVPGSSIVALRGEGFVEAPIARVASVLADRKRSVEWIDRLVKTKVLRQISETESINWNHIKTPTPLKDRDFVFKSTITTDPGRKKVVFSYWSVTDPLAPETDDYVRGSFKAGKFELTMATRTNKDGTKTRGTIVNAEVEVDPAGSVPTFIVNMVQKSWPHKTLTALRKQVAKPDIKDDPRVVERLTREGFLQ
ncbi:MAG: START domain-containing protein [Myxococcales bacterium]